MKYLLDTHTLLWFFKGDAKLSKLVTEIIKDKSNPVYLSVVNIWEIAIKNSIGKLRLHKTIEAIIEDAKKDNILILNIKTEHALKVKELPLHHKDPFDRMLIAQAIVEDFKIISVDEVFDQYEIEKVW